MRSTGVYQPERFTIGVLGRRGVLQRVDRFGVNHYRVERLHQRGAVCQLCGEAFGSVTGLSGALKRFRPAAEQRDIESFDTEPMGDSPA